MAKISKTYKPSQKEKFMNAKMKEYFKQKLLNWKSDLLKESNQTLNNLQTDNEAKPDITDRASEEIDRAFELIDICDKEKINELINKYRPDSIMHLAAESHVDRSIDSPMDFINTNIVGTYVLLEVSRKYWNLLDLHFQN